MNCVTIINRGRCPRLSIELMGRSGSRSNPEAIGRFGSGSAYAVTLAMRLGIEVSIESEDDRGPYVMEPWSDADGRVHWRFKPGSALIPSWRHSAAKFFGRARSTPTSFTTDMGIECWNGAWPVLREFVTNARDADSDAYLVSTDDGSEWVSTYLDMARSDGYDGVTIVRLKGSPELVAMVESEWDLHFRFEDGRRMTMSRRRNAADEVFHLAGETLHSKFMGTPPMLFHRGVRVHHNLKQESLFDYTLVVDLNESRTLNGDFMFRLRCARLILAAARALGSAWFGHVVKWVHDRPQSFEASLPMEYAEVAETTTAKAFVHAFGDSALVAGPDDPAHEHGVKLAQSWASLVKQGGVSTTSKPLAGAVAPTTWISFRDDSIDLREVAKAILDFAERSIEQSVHVGVTMHQLRVLRIHLGLQGKAESEVEEVRF